MILELNLKYGSDINIATMAERTLGTLGKTIAWGLFYFFSTVL